MEPFQNNESCFATVKKYRLVAKGMQSAVVYLESGMALEKADVSFPSRSFGLFSSFPSHEAHFF